MYETPKFLSIKWRRKLVIEWMRKKTKKTLQIVFTSYFIHISCSQEKGNCCILLEFVREYWSSASFLKVFIFEWEAFICSICLIIDQINVCLIVIQINVCSTCLTDSLENWLFFSLLNVYFHLSNQIKWRKNMDLAILNFQYFLFICMFNNFYISRLPIYVFLQGPLSQEYFIQAFHLNK